MDSKTRAPDLRFMPGLDGLRAVAVLAVIGFHNFSWLPGGFYGVDAFFVLSGFLITSLLVIEWEGSGTVRLARFWGRRARRLLPAVFLLVAGVGIVAALWPAAFGPVDLLPNAVATVFYSANWYFIWGHAGYFAASGPPSPLLHTWSLAIEEQFYLVWPLIVLAILRLRRPGVGAAATGRRRRLELLFVLSVLGAVASAVWMAVVAPVGGSTTRAYYGTDTRAQALLVGAALAAAFARWGTSGEEWRGRATMRHAFALAALAGAAGTAVAWSLVTFTSALAFHGGFLLVSLSAAAVIAGVVVSPGSVVPRVLAARPLRWLGRISYGVYLWYWPVLLVMDATRMHATGWSLFAERVVVTVALAAASYRFVEMPVRHGAFPRWRAVVAAPLAAGLALVAVAAAAWIPSSQGPAGPSRAAASQPVGSAGSGGERSTGSPRPVKVLVVGDSVAGSLGVGLSEEAPAYDVDLVNEGDPGCSVSMDQSIRVLWYTISPGPPCRSGDPGALLSTWKQWVDSFNPDVVVYVARGELFDQELDGRWTNLDQPLFDGHVAERFSRGIDVLGSRGASVVLLTTPYYESGRQPDGAPWPEDEPSRVSIDNSIIRRVAGEAGTATGGRKKVTVFDLGGLVSPGGHYASTVDGVGMRCSDGVHFTAAGGAWVARRLLPTLAELGRGHRESTPGGAWPGVRPPSVPAWWSKLTCR
jgi:peptidoglycan/LPS O-acetylase OafA/YrhL